MAAATVLLLDRRSLGMRRAGAFRLRSQPRAARRRAALWHVFSLVWLQAHDMPVVYPLRRLDDRDAGSGARALFPRPDGREHPDRTFLAPADRVGCDGACALHGRDRSPLSDARLPDRAHPVALYPGRALFRPAGGDQRAKRAAIRSGSAYFWLQADRDDRLGALSAELSHRDGSATAPTSPSSW